MSVFKNVKLVDAQEKAEKHPNKFEVPTKRKLNNLKIDDIVKICDGEERFWVIITDVHKNQIVGKIDNNLIGDQEYGAGDHIHFEKNNIYDVYSE